MRVIWVVVGGLVGLVVGAMIGFGVAIAAMSASQGRGDGTYGFREMLVCLPSGAFLGLATGLVWGFRTSLAGA